MLLKFTKLLIPMLQPADTVPFVGRALISALTRDAESRGQSTSGFPIPASVVPFQLFALISTNHKESRMRRRLSLSLMGCWTVLLVAGCGGESGPVSAGAAPATGATVKLQGAGASFPAPLYNKWFKSYSAAHQNVLVDYQSVGSGGGVKSVIDRTVDFGASDAAMKTEDMAKVPDGVQLFPMTAGSIVLSYNLPGVENLKLSRKAYGGIFTRDGEAVERSGDCRGQPRHEAARPADQCRRASRQQRDLVRLLSAPCRHQP